MDNTKYESNDLKIICPEDCGNAPKKQLLKELNIAFVNNDLVFMIDNITDDFQWNIIGKELIQGKENFIETLKQMQNSKVTELHISKIITHGYDGSINGTLILENKKIYSFCNVYKFTSSRNNSKIKECISYIIELP
ncbi:hypothetical protein J22TS1_11270 [Siminovitchia terrae]|uniref:Nuclear transport factor 2 family protein n=1 Tax=Siminovitchia terrae TaxID=1914933 RepID=A0A429X7A4_SIMTE|nr:nuclear transport factor 2 family protein [Siminovitchia terrae]RST59318.1 nuclear transport factor 2 family protein [Siminovitchia terrae]GIN90076.1 hypothetical protein J22TS1_11270 [Siminovitchia terrae]